MQKKQKKIIKKPKIIFIVNDLNIGGAEKHLLRVLPKLKNKFLIYVFTLIEPGKLAFELEKEGIKIISPCCYKIFFKLKNKLTPVRYFFSFVKLIFLLFSHKGYNFFAMHFFLPRAYMIGALAGIITCQKNMIMSRRIVYSATYKKTFFFKIEKYLHRYLRFALACSRDIYQELLDEGVDKNKLRIIYNGIAYENFLTPPDKNIAKKKFGIANDQLVFSIVASLHKRKGHKDLLCALYLIKNKLPKNWVLLIVGRDAGEEGELKTLAQDFKLTQSIKWLGEINNICDVLAASDFGILCSHEEGFSNALLESMASGLAMIVSDVSGNNEAVIDGVNGYIVPSKDVKKLSSAILKLSFSQNLQKKMGDASKERVKYFSISETITRYNELYSFLFKLKNEHCEKNLLQ